ncbi:MAG: glycosyltransferase 87 family protein [Acidobacteriota bacterium]
MSHSRTLHAAAAESPKRRRSVGRLLVTAAGALALAPLWAQALDALELRGTSGSSVHTAPGSAVFLTLSALAVAWAASVAASRGARVAALVAATTGSLAGLVVTLSHPGLAPAAQPLAVLATLGGLVGGAAGFAWRHLPPWIDAAFALRRRRALVWTLTALFAVIQLARFATWAADPSRSSAHGLFVPALALQATGFLAVALWLAVWIGGRPGRLAAAAVPLVLSAFPVLHSMRIDAHGGVLVLAVGAMLAFDRRRTMLGGALLAAAVVVEPFPVVLVALLVGSRRWPAVGATMLGITVCIAAALATYGRGPVIDFATDQLPRFGDGAVFAFADAWPEGRELVIAAWTTRIGVVGLLGAALWLGARQRRQRERRCTDDCRVVVPEPHHLRADRAIGWLALLGLGSLAGAGAVADWIPAAAVWMLTLTLYRLGHWSSIRRVVRHLAWIVLFALHSGLLGAVSLGPWADLQRPGPASLLAALVLFGTQAWGLARAWHSAAFDVAARRALVASRRGFERRAA